MEPHLKELLDHWLTKKSWTPFPFQRESWDQYLKGHSGIVNAPTGSGKTMSLWVPMLLEYIRNNPNFSKSKRNGLQILWITPLRALAKDIQIAMQQVSLEFGMQWTVECRTGDTAYSRKKKQLTNAPECLITTPESLHMLIAQKGYDKYFKNLKCIAIDEWHELLGTKRGVQVELGISRLKSLTKEPLKIWGISATIGNFEEARSALFGPDLVKHTKVIKSKIRKKLEMTTVLPDTMIDFPWAGHMGTRLVSKVVDIVKENNSTLIFCNTRNQTEVWYRNLMSEAPELAGLVAMHHGSLDPAVRKWVEDRLNLGKMKAVVCTSSLDLGVDFRPVDTVIQIGGPKGIARFLQRAGRSGHQPGATSRIFFVPTHALEMVEAVALRYAIKKRLFESRKPLRLSYDVLIQFLVTLSVSEGFRSAETFKEIKSTFAYSELTEGEWDWILHFITHGGKTLGQYEEFNKVNEVDGLFKISNVRMARRHKFSMGTIVGDPVLKVKYLGGKYIGTVEEVFISRLKEGTVFWFAGRNLQFLYIKGMTAYVKNSKRKASLTPQWGGGRLPLSSLLSEEIRHQLTLAAQHNYKDPEIKKLRPVLKLQSQWSIIPKQDELLIELFSSDEGHHLLIYPFEGRAVHEVLSALIAYRISKIKPISFSMAYNDYGFELLSDQEIPIIEALESDLFRMDDFIEDVFRSINEGEMGKRKFRDIAVIAGMVFQGYPNENIAGKHIQASSQIIYQVFEKYDPENILLQQAKDEVITLQLEISRLQSAIERINQQKIRFLSPPLPTPFAFPIMADRLRSKFSSEDIAHQIMKMQKQLAAK